MTAETQTFSRGNGHGAMDYAQLHENLEGEAEKGVVTGGVILQ
jgi:hypothetical protein